ncbi:kinase-like domain protein [Fusarium subglutinans]|uniref:Kinase-like domain protein n=1 Tax=Gibberella subglutinans TaxID=42677 RepID=A0A8H5P5R9_GIBSU|nr:kinase-like domain protein [Fusarium subglutinans]KAF5587785.1 kinase-like domain protein [Fusarium subglutinans]
MLLIDLEQGGTWDTLCAPEILYTSWMKRLARDDAVPASKRLEYETLLSVTLSQRTYRQELYSSPPRGYYDEWINLTAEMQESAMVFALGKVLWCMFEGCSHTLNGLDENYTKAVTTQFPEFRNTPLRLRKLIQSCTLGDPETQSLDIRVQKRGHLFFTERRNSRGDYVADISPLEIIKTAQELASIRLSDMEFHETAKARHMEGRHQNGYSELLRFAERPKLEDVLKTLRQYAAWID